MFTIESIAGIASIVAAMGATAAVVVALLNWRATSAMARSTKKYVQATNELAQASKASVDEMRAESLMRIRPRIVFTRNLDPYMQGQISMIPLFIENMGDSDAKGLDVSMVDHPLLEQKRDPDSGYDYFEGGTKGQLELRPVPKASLPGEVSVCLQLHYRDVEGHHYVTEYCEARLSRDSRTDQLRLGPFGEPQFLGPLE